MNVRRTVVFWCLVAVCWVAAAAADREDAAEEILDDQDLKADNETSSAEVGPPDSHEAMNNREVNPKIRDKRSYEFLLGLINNNSRYEVTRVDPSLVTEKPKVHNESKLAASELLLELMVRIASHPQQWEKVHRLLQKLDRDLTTSRSIVNKLHLNSSLQNPETKHPEIFVNKKKIIHSEEDTSFPREQSPSEVLDTRKTFSPVYDKEPKWPTFDMIESESDVKFVNNSKEASSSNERESQKYRGQVQNKSAKITYPKNFSYHRVTGKPTYLNKNPTAYIAVSAVAPKDPVQDSQDDDDVTLENELHRLKPWPRPASKKGTTLRPRWGARSEERGRSP